MTGEQPRIPRQRDEQHIRPASPDDTVLFTSIPRQGGGEVRGENRATDETQLLPSAAGNAPVFVDTTGRRRWRIRLIFYSVLAVVAGYSLLVGTSLLGGPLSPDSLVPFPIVLNGQNTEPDADQSVPATPTATATNTPTPEPSRSTAPPADVDPPRTSPRPPTRQPTRSTPTPPATQPTRPESTPMTPSPAPTTEKPTPPTTQPPTTPGTA